MVGMSWAISRNLKLPQESLAVTCKSWILWSLFIFGCEICVKSSSNWSITSTTATWKLSASFEIASSASSSLWYKDTAQQQKHAQIHHTTAQWIQEYMWDYKHRSLSEAPTSTQIVHFLEFRFRFGGGGLIFLEEQNLEPLGEILPYNKIISGTNHGCTHIIVPQGHTSVIGPNYNRRT